MRKGFAQGYLVVGAILLLVFLMKGDQGMPPPESAVGCYNTCAFGQAQYPYPDCGCYWDIFPTTTTVAVPEDEDATTTTVQVSTCDSTCQRAGYSSGYQAMSSGPPFYIYRCNVGYILYNRVCCCKTGTSATTTTLKPTTTTVAVSSRWYCCSDRFGYARCYEKGCPLGYKLVGDFSSSKEIGRAHV